MLRRKYTLPFMVIVALWLVMSWWVGAARASYPVQPKQATTGTVTPAAGTITTTAVADSGVQLHFADSEQARTGSFALSVDALPPLPAGTHYELWMQDADGNVLNLGAVETNVADESFGGSTNQELLFLYESALLSVEVDESTVTTPTLVVFSGTLPSSLLEPLRNLYFGQQFISTGVMAGMQSEAELALVHSQAVMDALSDGDRTAARREAERVLNVIDGKDGLYYGDLDHDGTENNPGDGHGLMVYLADLKQEGEALLEELPDSSADAATVEQLVESTQSVQLVLEPAISHLNELFAADSVEAARPMARAAHLQLQSAAAQVQELYRAGLELSVIDLEQVAPIPTPEPTATPTKLPSGNTGTEAGPSPSPTEALETVPVPKPDLKLERMIITPRNNECGEVEDLDLLVTVKNVGEEVAGAFVIDVNGARRQVDPGLAPGKSVRLWFLDYEETNTAIIDPIDAIDEVSEENNAFTVDLGATVVPTCVPTITPTFIATPTPSPTEMPEDTATPTITPTPTQTSTPSPDQKIAAIKELPSIRANFGNNPPYWYLATDFSKVQVVGDILEMSIQTPNYANWSGFLMNLKNYYVEVDATVTKVGEDDLYSKHGIIFNYQSTETYDFFAINSSGDYCVWRKVDGEYTQIVPWTHWTVPGVINTGVGSTNRLGLYMDDQRFILVANGVVLEEVPNVTPPVGSVTPGASTANVTEYVVQFENAAWWDLTP